MTRRQRVLRVVAFSLLGVAALLSVALFVFTQTDWGREQVRRVVVQQVRRSTDGEIEVARLEGNLLRRFRFVGVTIRDEQRRPFVAADTIVTAYSLRSLVRRRIALRDVRLVNAGVVLDQPPGEDWNYVRIFRLEPRPEEPLRPGWGAWIRLERVTILNGRITVRSEWQPDAESPAERERMVTKALSEDSRTNIVRVPGGFQNVLDFRDLNARLPLVRLADPESDALRVDVASLSGIAQPFRPPAAEFHDLAGEFRLSSDSLWFENVRAVLPGTVAEGRGVYRLETAELHLDLYGAPLALADLRWLYPRLPEEGGGRLRLVLSRRELATSFHASRMELEVGASRLAGTLGMTVGDTFRIYDTDLRMSALETRLVQRVIPAFAPPRHGRLDGRLALQGTPTALQVNGDVAFTEPATGRSRVLAAGGLGFGPAVRFRSLRLRFDPLQVGLIREYVPVLPARSTMVGQVVLDGVPEQIRVDGDMTLRDPVTGTSRVFARGEIATRDELRFRGLQLRFDPLRLDLARAHEPDLPRGATLTGAIRLDGAPARALSVDGELALRDPATGLSRVAARGAVHYADGVRFEQLALRLNPLQLDLVRTFVDDAQELPAGVTVTGPLRLDGALVGMLAVDGDLELQDPATGRSRIAARGGVAFAEDLRFQDLALNFSPFQLDFVRPLMPDDFELPRGIALHGPLRLDGAAAGMLAVDGDLEIRDPVTGVSQVAARGGIAFAEQLRFRNLALRLYPLQVDLIDRFGGDVPIGGVARGNVRVDGRPDVRLALSGELEHVEAGERSHVAGEVDVIVGERARVDVRVLPLSLATVGRFVPQAGLRGTVTGDIAAIGRIQSLALHVDLAVAGGGHIAGRGRLDFAGPQVGYDVETRLRDFDLAAVTARAPATTSLTGALAAIGRGFEPASMRATIDADLVGPRIDGLAADRVRLRASVANGLAAFDSSLVELAGAEAWLHGTFGLVAGQYGELTYRVTLDSLHAFAPWVPAADTGVAVPRPAVRAAARDEAVAQAERELADWQVERIATGRAPPPPAPVDTVHAGEVPRDSLAGRLHAAGTLRGNIRRADAWGRIEVDDLVFRGNYIGRGRVDHAVLALGTPSPTIDVAGEFDDLVVEGFALDSAYLRIEHQGLRYGTGRAVLAAWQDHDTDYRADVSFTLALERSELHLHDLLLRFDTVTWRTTQPGLVSWGGAGVDVEHLELRGEPGGRIFLHGQLPIDGPANLDLVADSIRLEHIASLLQYERVTRGLASLEGRLLGTLRDPVLVGRLSVVDAEHDGRALPDVAAVIDYEQRELLFEAQLLEDGRLVGEAEGQLPIDLALVGQEGSRLLPGAIAVDVRADDLPLDALSLLTDELTDVTGRAAAIMSVRGTFDVPTFAGGAAVRGGEFRLAQLGIRFRDAVLDARLEGQTLHIDSLVARSDGRVRVAGELDLTTPARPGFDLTIQAREAQVLRNDRGNLWLDADLTVSGPFDGVLVQGAVTSRRGVIYLPESDNKNVVALDTPEAEAALDPTDLKENGARERSPLLANMEIHVDVYITETWVRTTDANIEIYTPDEIGPLAVMIDPANDGLALVGTVNSDRGTYNFLGRRFEVTRGAATFVGDGDLNPILQVAAEHEVQLPGREALEIRIVLGGTMREPTITLESSAQPPISQTELLSYLVFGRGAASLLQQQGSALAGQGATGGELTGNVAGFAAVQLAGAAMTALLDEFESEMARELGLDVLHISPADVPAELFTGGFADMLRGTEVEAGRYVLPRLFAAVSLRPALETAPGVQLEYRGPRGLRWNLAWEPRFLPPEPTLREQELDRTRVLGAFLWREWRF
jgi:hypothetical protein